VSDVGSELFSRVHPILPLRQPNTIRRNPRVSAAFHPDAHPRGPASTPAECGRHRQNRRYGGLLGHRQNRVSNITVPRAVTHAPQSVPNLAPICPKSGPNLRARTRRNAVECRKTSGRITAERERTEKKFFRSHARFQRNGFGRASLAFVSKSLPSTISTVRSIDGHATRLQNASYEFAKQGRQIMSARRVVLGGRLSMYARSGMLTINLVSPRPCSQYAS